MSNTRTHTLYIVIHRAEVEFPEYHAVVLRDGTVQRNRDWNLKDQCVRNFNSLSVSVAFQGCFCSGYRAKYSRPTPEQWDAGAALVAELLGLYPDAKVTGHTELGTGATYSVEKLQRDKACPGDLFDMNKFRSDVRALVHPNSSRLV